MSGAARELEPLLDLKGAAAVLGCSAKTAYRLAVAGDLPAVRFGVAGRRQLLRFRPADVRAFVDAHQVRPVRAARPRSVSKVHRQ